MDTELNLIRKELKNIKDDLSYIKEHMAERDMFLDAKEKQLLQESFEHEKKGELVSSKELRKELGV